MVPTVVLDDSTTAPLTMNTVSHNNQSGPARSDNPYSFSVFQITTLGSGDAIIRTLVIVPISAFNIVN